MLLLSAEIYIITFFFAVVLSIFVLLNDYKNRVNQFFSLLSFSNGLWILSNILINLAYDQILSLLFIRIAIIWVALLPIFFNQFVKYLYFSQDIKYKKLNKIFFYIACVITSFIILFSQTRFNVKNISFESWGVGYEPGILYIVLLFYMLVVFGFSFFHLLKISLESKNQKKYQARFILFWDMDLQVCLDHLLSSSSSSSLPTPSLVITCSISA